jgi:hypothetical protein
MNTATRARRLGGDALARDTIVPPVTGHPPKDCSLAVKLDPRAPDGLTIHSYERGPRSAATSGQSIAINHERNCHGATSLATVAEEFVCTHEHYLTS